MAIHNIWADICTGFSISGGMVKLHMGVVEVRQPQQGQANDVEDAQRIRLTETIALPLPGFAQMLSAMDELREHPDIKRCLLQISEEKERLQQANGS